MSRRLPLLLAVPLAFMMPSVGYMQPRPAQQTSQPEPGQERATASPAQLSLQHAMINRYCVTCHNSRTLRGGLALEVMNIDNAGEHPEIWEKVIRKVRGGVMPPANNPRPDKPTLDGLASALEESLDAIAAVKPNPGRTEALHRLNRSEYHNVIRDLLTLDVDATSMLPADNGSYGFDNIAGVLKVSPLLMERYLSAAQKISRLAVGAPVPPTTETITLPTDLAQDDRLEPLPFGTRGGTAIRYNFPADGEYNIKVELLKNRDGLIFISEPHQLEVSVDGERVKVFPIVPAPRRGRGRGGAPVDVNAADAPGSSVNADEPTGDPQSGVFEVRIPLKAGPRVVGVTFLKKTSAEVETLRQPFLRPAWAYSEFLVAVGSVTISGPFAAAGGAPREETPSRNRIFVCHPTKPAGETACAKTILSTLARRAFRRPVTDQDVQALLAFYNDGRASQLDFEGGIELALRRLLVSPEFLFRVERDPVGAAPGSVYHISDLELASRLSFFLWSSMPDDELLDVAARGHLKDPVELERQVRRMLSDTRSEAFVKNFAGQWLYLRNLPAARPDNALFPDFDENLREAMQQETELFFDSIVHEDHSLLDMLTANYSFINERLARLYGVPNVYGSQFRRVVFPADSPRHGILGQASLLTATSQANRTSPTIRGKWILENVLGTPPPAPPPNVPSLPETNDGNKVMTMRERMSQHRANPVCASCHALIDPPGFALENFDAVGEWRTLSEAGTPLDASGALPDGTKFDGANGLRDALLGRSGAFVTTATEKLMTYALGRGLEYYDAPAIRNVVRSAQANNYRFSSLVLGIVSSTPFQMRRSKS
jgi:uncharacterized protein DUF1592/uncharacterized protein DUF1588/uncharacterized protein DUF1585/uncharacterized protein DUF1587/uncharacterized protein DUF1595